MSRPSASSPEAPLCGVIGRYQVLRRIGVGGMAEVYLAQVSGPHGFAKQLVLKRIRPELARDGRFVRMFLDEARLAALLQHANIAQVFDVGEIDGEYIMAMEYVSGRTVGDLIGVARRAGAPGLPVEQALVIASEVASGLHHAHERCDAAGNPLGIVHRDVSPSNVLVDYDGKVKLLDFGVAKSALPRSTTRAGVIKGKLRYMSPEQLQAQPIDRRSDLFSLGALLYEMLAGAPPFDGRSDAEIVGQILRGRPAPLAHRRPDVPVELAEIAARLLAREPAARPPTAQDVQLALEAVARRAALDRSSIGLALYVRDLVGPPDPTPSPRAIEHTPPPEEFRTASLRIAPGAPGDQHPSDPTRQSGTRLIPDDEQDDREEDEGGSADLTMPVSLHLRLDPLESRASTRLELRKPRTSRARFAIAVGLSLAAVAALVGLRQLRSGRGEADAEALAPFDDPAPSSAETPERRGEVPERTASPAAVDTGAPAAAGTASPAAVGTGSPAAPPAQRRRRAQPPRGERGRGRDERVQRAAAPPAGSAAPPLDSAADWDPDSPLLPSQRQRLEKRAGDP